MRSDDERLEVLTLEIGEREDKRMWIDVFSDVIARGLDAEAVELGVMDGLAGKEFKRRTKAMEIVGGAATPYRLAP
ncbi:MAG: hypothetical protein D6760_06960 [Deltaproteobacteria bacterium]|nr:MAG: hypothetical protein D6760_06960 [Deltaproteobacteria bacterium]